MTPLELLYYAASTRFGIVVSFASSFDSARMALYTAKRKAGDPTLNKLQFRASPLNPSHLFIVKGGQIEPIGGPNEQSD